MKKRIALWDNLKFLLIIFVVIGHYTQQFRADNEILQRIYVFIYSFHMPIFIFVTGLFSKKAVDEKNIKKALPYLTCFFTTTLILFITKALLGWAPVFELFSPSGISWYLMSMFFMFLITMLIKDYKPQYIFVLSLIIGVMCGFVQTENPDFFTWMRTLTFYPFFCLGYISDREKIEKATNKISIKITAVIFFVAIYLLIYFYPKQANKISRLNTARHTYSELGRFAPYGWELRLLTYAISFAAIFLLISLIPRKKIKGFTSLGERTLGIYMFHYVIIYTAVYVLKIQNIFKSTSDIGFAYFIILIAILTAYICSNKGCNYIAQKLFSAKDKLKG
ncbi:acyltransferase family protein [uncultured Eubacterium sp.]|uniref:acyltransferase family protein n=1 Tax=uncultured Eubacterium sp. TaxID=165185 RepID=UPI0025D08517|nr:acyltransferase family protein [uncultured Eubacterium sp.]